MSAKGLEFLQRQVSELKRENAKLKKDLLIDDLTGLFNARCLRERLLNCVQDMHRAESQPALLFIDVDHFKDVNERFGHQAAGLVLGQLGRLIASVVRCEDVGFRYGGDEFVVLVSGGEAGARKVGERIRRRVESHVFRARTLRGIRPIRITVSIGLRTVQAGEAIEHVLEEADRAMFEAKRLSRNTLMAA